MYSPLANFAASLQFFKKPRFSLLRLTTTFSTYFDIFLVVSVDTSSAIITS